MNTTNTFDTLDRLRTELERLKPAVNHIEAAKATTAAVEKLPKLYETQLMHIDEQLGKLIANLTKRYQSQMAGLTTELEAVQTQVQAEIQTLNNLKQEMADYSERINAVDFPTRLEKLDTSVAGIVMATQTTQSRLNDVERSVNERIGQAQAAAKQARMYALITLIAVVLGGGVILTTLLSQ